MLKISFAGIAYEVKEWDGTYVGDTIAVDTETIDIESESHIPDLVIMQVCDGKTVFMLDRDNSTAFWKMHCKCKAVIFHNCSFDLNVLKKFTGVDFADMVDEGRVWDTGILYQLHTLATKGNVARRWGLDAAAKFYFGVDVSKDSEVRMGWGVNMRLKTLPAERVIYAAKDAAITWRLWEATSWVREQPNALTHHIQVKGQIALNYTTKNGMEFDLVNKDKHLSVWSAAVDDAKEALEAYNYFVGRKKGKHYEGTQAVLQNILKLVEEQASESTPPLKRLESGKYSTAAGDIESLREDNSFIDSYLLYKEYSKLRDFLSKLNSNRIHSRYNNIMNTGRTSATSPNCQNYPRREGVRECFIPKEGHVLIACDYAQLELRTFAQHAYSTFGFSAMRDFINKDMDLHKRLGAELEGSTYETCSKQARQQSKALNFGYLGGLGVTKFRDYALATYGVSMTQEEAVRSREVWLKTFPEAEEHLKDRVFDNISWGTNPISKDFEMARLVTAKILKGNYNNNKGEQYPGEYMKWVYYNVICVKAPWLKGSEYVPDKHLKYVAGETVSTITGRMRAYTMYCAARNTVFQGLAADVAKEALWLCYKAGLTMVAFIHDEIIIEAPLETYKEQAKLLEDLMIQGFDKHCPDVKGEVECHAMSVWSKKAYPVKLEDGSLGIWKP